MICNLISVLTSSISDGSQILCIKWTQNKLKLKLNKPRNTSCTEFEPSSAWLIKPVRELHIATHTYTFLRWPGWHGRSSDLLRAGRSRFECRWERNFPDQCSGPKGPLILLYNAYRAQIIYKYGVSFLGVKWLGRSAGHPPRSSDGVAYGYSYTILYLLTPWCRVRLE